MENHQINPRNSGFKQLWFVDQLSKSKVCHTTAEVAWLPGCIDSRKWSNQEVIWNNKCKKSNIYVQLYFHFCYYLNFLIPASLKIYDFFLFEIHLLDTFFPSEENFTNWLCHSIHVPGQGLCFIFERYFSCFIPAVDNLKFHWTNFLLVLTNY